MRSDPLAALGMAAILCVAAAQVRAQGGSSDEFEVPVNSLAYEDTGKLDEVQSDVIHVHDSKNEAWLIKVVPQTKVTVDGEAEADYLRPGVYVQITGPIDKKGMFKEPVNEIEIIMAPGKGGVGLFSTAEGASTTKAVRNPGAGSYRIRGKVATFKDGELLLIAGKSKIGGKIGDELKVKLNLDDLSLAQNGDEIKIKAWYYDRNKPNPVFNRPGQALAEEVTVTLSKPLTGTGKKPRTTAKAAKTSK